MDHRRRAPVAVAARRTLEGCAPPASVYKGRGRKPERAVAPPPVSTSPSRRLRAKPDVQAEDLREARRARLFGRPRHFDHPQVAADHLRLRSRHLHRRSRPGRRTGAGAAQGGAARRQARAHLHRGSARGIRPRLRLPDVPRQRAIRGPVSARHLDRPAADRQKAGRDRPPGRRRRDRPWRDRQGQRPGALRTLRLRARARHQDHRAVARMGFPLAHGADRLRREAPDPDIQGQARRSAVLDRRQPAARLLGGEGARGPGGRDAALRLFAHHRSRIGARQADDRRDRVRERRSGGDRRQAPFARRAADRAQQARPRQRRRPARPGREPLRRHEVARHVRDARRHDPARRPSRDRVRSRSIAARRISRTS